MSCGEPARRSLAALMQRSFPPLAELRSGIGLRGYERCIDTTCADELRVRACLGHVTVIEHHDQVRVRRSTQPVGDAGRKEGGPGFRPSLLIAF